VLLFREPVAVAAATFATRLRQTVDLDTVRGELTDAVHRAFEPAHLGPGYPGRCGQRAGRPMVKTSWFCWVAIEPIPVTAEPDAASAVIW
jgi:hypothetical protein